MKISNSVLRLKNFEEFWKKGKKDKIMKIWQIVKENKKIFKE